MILSRAALALTLALATPLINSVAAVDNLFTSQPYSTSEDGGKMRLIVSYNSENARESIASQTLTLQGEGVQVQEVSNYNFKRAYAFTSSADAGGDDAEGWVQEGAMSTGYSVLEFDSSDIKAEMEALRKISGVVAVEKDAVAHALSLSTSTRNVREGKGGAKDHMQGIQEAIKASADKFPEEGGAIHDHGRRLAYSFAPFCESTQFYGYDSGHTKTAATEISIDNAPWIQLDLTGTELAAGSTLTIESETSSEEITSDILAANVFSSVFDGNSVTVTLTTPGDDSSRILIPSVNVGICKDDDEVSNDSICGDVDDRVPSTDHRAGRIGGCTGWLISEDVFIQAGHCGTPSSSTRIHFTFGRSSAPTADQYAVDVSSYQGVNGGVGNDWGVGRLLPNSSTGKLPGVAQSEKCGTPGCGWYELGAVPSEPNGNNIRVTGYGTAAVDSRSQKTHVGPLFSIASTSLRYKPDTTGGNSGSPVIHEETGKAIGVHTHGGCSATGGSNLGTRIDRPDFAAKIASLLGPTPSPVPTSQPTPMPTNEDDGPQDYVPYGIDMVESAYVHDKPDPGNDPITICVVDTGYDLGHVDLPNSSHGVDGYSYSPYGSDQLWDVDGHSHGTHCAGTIGAIGDNNIGVTSVNPDPTKFRFYIGKGLTNSGSGNYSGVMAAINACVSNGAKVISLSLGGGTNSGSFDTLVKNHYDNGVLLIAAAGNGGSSASPIYPASHTAVMSIAAVNSGRTRASFSQTNDQVELSGPGVSTFSTTPGNGYGYKSGTSMATPHVAGVAALIWYHFPDCTNNQIRNVLIYSSEDRGDPSWDSSYGWGIVNARAAYDLLESQGCEAGGPSDYGIPLSQVGLGGKDQLSLVPTNAPTSSTASPTKAPSSSPTQSPTTAQPTSSPTTASPTSSSPTQQPTTAQPSQSPTTAQPTSLPSNAPSKSPTNLPTPLPSKSPTNSPTTRQPTHAPSDPPFTSKPTEIPTPLPSKSPTKNPTSEPTAPPSPSPSSPPSSAPSKSPTNEPTTSNPTSSPTSSPTKAPITSSPTKAPVVQTNPPSASPSASPTASPSSAPTSNPTEAPTSSPSNAPTGQPVSAPPTPAPVMSKSLVCGRGDIPSKPCAEGLEGTDLITETHEVRCCRDCAGLNCKKPWKRKCRDFDSNLFARSKYAGECKVGTFAEAIDFCRNIPGQNTRLCTPEEVKNSCTKGTGCKFDKEQIWACAYDGLVCNSDEDCCGKCNSSGVCEGEYTLFP